MAWYVYILKCADDTLYTGITTDLLRRMHEHNHPPLGAKYVKARRPAQLVFSCAMPNRSKASQEEYRIKALSKTQKLKLIAS